MTPRTTDGNQATRDSTGQGKWWQIVVGTALVGAVGWYLATCLGEQREARRNVRQAWSAVRTTSQKYMDSRAAAYDHMSLFFLRLAREQPPAEWIEGRQRELIAMLDAAEVDCNATKLARYDFERQLRYTCRRLAVKVPELSNTTLTEQMCGAHARAAARLRLVDPVELSKTTDRSKFEAARDTIGENLRVVTSTREAEHDHDRRVDEFLREAEGRSFWRDIWACVKTTAGSS